MIIIPPGSDVLIFDISYIKLFYNILILFYFQDQVLLILSRKLLRHAEYKSFFVTKIDFLPNRVSAGSGRCTMNLNYKERLKRATLTDIFPDF
ncbi:hypothetical protein [Leptospira mayottensis]|uniref:Uncharacterized protein n=2 Tax=Leptospira mayottensis TaxID=1137606 RepID=A0AA87MRR6_9LEPT|nr:hypothetical protein [Leptospira mayottensis]AXR62975.1 hypothetical protein DQM28_00610 [Leptospira mayottensis]EKS00675.1 hypothetical protein LEP1GSC125_1447 [Leptospira mayottensis 200901122]